MDDFESLSHSRWECKYHVVFIPKCRRKTLYLQLRGHLGEVFRRDEQVIREYITNQEQEDLRLDQLRLWS
jgi:putative transposase